MESTKLQLFDLCVQLLSEKKFEDGMNEAWAIKGIMTNNDACMSFIYNYFIENRLDPERRQVLFNVLFEYARANTWLKSEFHDFCEENSIGNYTFEEFLNGLLGSRNYDFSEARGNNDTTNISFGTICLLKNMLSLLSIDPAVTNLNDPHAIRDSTPDPNALLQPWGA